MNEMMIPDGPLGLSVASCFVCGTDVEPSLALATSCLATSVTPETRHWWPLASALQVAELLSDDDDEEWHGWARTGAPAS